MLEIGIGSGLNLPFYLDGVRNILGLEPSPRLFTMAQQPANASAVPAFFIAGSNNFFRRQIQSIAPKSEPTVG
ncbi:MAG: hypothetical protein PF501_16750 [Salinisphaera sp.]|nr:hypothetical protein [Salinisphaera sp.]